MEKASTRTKQAGAWKCRLPTFVRSFFFRTLDHKFVDSGRTETMSIHDHEEICARCGNYRHYTQIPRSGLVVWIDGPHPMAGGAK